MSSELENAGCTEIRLPQANILHVLGQAERGHRSSNTNLFLIRREIELSMKNASLLQIPLVRKCANTINWYH